MNSIAVIGLGYVGLPLAVALSGKYNVIGFDQNEERISNLKKFYDTNHEFSAKELTACNRLSYSSSTDLLHEAEIFIITVPTPIHVNKTPDLRNLENATRTVGKFLKNNSLIIYESTVYPGCTEDFCVPILEEVSGLVFNKDFFCGYSPERINTADSEHSLSNVVKVTSGSTKAALERVDTLYKSIIKAGTFPVSSIKIAESAKIIENCQRDINIAFMNELEIMLDRMNIDIREVLRAASTKWNFLNFRPGLVGGHCIGVDPYYLAHKAKEVGLHPEVVLAGRKINDEHPSYYAHKILVKLVQGGINPIGAKILILGLSFKPNCRDVRNSKIIDVIEHLDELGCQVSVCDPLVDSHVAARVCKSKFYSKLDDVDTSDFELVVGLVLHDSFNYSKLIGEKYFSLVHERRD